MLIPHFSRKLSSPLSLWYTEVIEKGASDIVG